jgi:hypothetical protein
MEALGADLKELSRRDEGYSQESSVRTTISQPRYEPATSHVRSKRADSKRVTLGIRTKEKKYHNFGREWKVEIVTERLEKNCDFSRGKVRTSSYKRYVSHSSS